MPSLLAVSCVFLHWLLPPVLCWSLWVGGGPTCFFLFEFPDFSVTSRHGAEGMSGVSPHYPQEFYGLGSLHLRNGFSFGFFR